MRCFIEDLSLNVYSYIDLFLHGSRSYDNHWQCQQRYYELLGQKSASFIWCIKTCMSLNSTEWLVEMVWRNFGKDWEFLQAELFLKFVPPPSPPHPPNSRKGWKKLFSLSKFNHKIKRRVGTLGHLYFMICNFF